MKKLFKALLFVFTILVGWTLADGCIYLMNLPSFLANLGMLGLIVVIGLVVMAFKFILEIK